MAPCTMMKPPFKGKTTSTNPMYSRNLIHPRVCDAWLGKHSPMSGLWHHTSQLY